MYLSLPALPVQFPASCLMYLFACPPLSDLRSWTRGSLTQCWFPCSQGAGMSVHPAFGDQSPPCFCYFLFLYFNVFIRSRFPLRRPSIPPADLHLAAQRELKTGVALILTWSHTAQLYSLPVLGPWESYFPKPQLPHLS